MSTVKVNTADLEGRALDWAVWATEKEPKKIMPRKGYYLNIPKFSSDWSQCGPVQVQNVISCYASTDPNTGGLYHWVGVKEGVPPFRRRGMVAKEPMTAICRAIVSSTLGDSVEIPAELLEVK